MSDEGVFFSWSIFDGSEHRIGHRCGRNQYRCGPDRPGERKILSFAKAPTTKDDLAKGISDVLKRLDRVYFPKINLISLSTTLATNSIVEGVRRRVCGILIGYGPEDYPPELKEEVVLVPGGHTVQGEEKEPLDLDRVRAVLESTKDRVEAYAVCGYFSVRNPDHELQVKRLIQESTDQPVDLRS